MPKAKVTDIEMYYEIHGEGTPLVLIRGWGGSSRNWHPSFIQVFSNHHRLVIFDNRGTGETSRPGTEYTIKLMADDTAGLMEAIGVEKAHIAGFSMGGMIAQEFTLNHPEKTISLTLGCTYCGGPHRIPATEAAKEIMNLKISPPKGMTSEEVSKRYLTLKYTPEYIEENLVQLLEAEHAANPTPPFVRKMHWDAIIEFDSYDRLPKVEAPTLVVHGERDVWVPPGNAKIIADRIPGSRLVFFENASHSFAESREKLIREILNFMGEVDSEA